MGAAEEANSIRAERTLVVMSGQPTDSSGFAEALADVVIGIRDDVDISRHVVRGEARYVVRDPISFQSHSLSTDDYHVYRTLDNSRTLGQLFDELVNQGRLEPGQEDEFYRFVVGLNQRGLLNLPISNAKKLYERFAARRRQSARTWWLKLFCFRLPLWKPDRFLDATFRFGALVFGRLFVGLWAVLAILSGVTLWTRWDEFQSPLASLLAVQNIPMTLLLIVVLKLWHELGHAYACKRFGGKVPEMGALFIVGTPCAYVDASSAWSFTRRRDRIVVNLGGIYFESFIAIVAVFLWNLTDPSSFWNSFAHRTIVVSTVVTFFFNLNPLMRYDGYFVLSDALGIPNLRQESMAAAQAWGKRWLLGVPAPRVGKNAWTDTAFVSFGMASMTYKVVVILGIFGLICYRFPVIGLAAGILYAGSAIFTSLYRLTTYLLLSAETRPVRARAIIVCSLLFVGTPSLVALLPVSSHVMLHGVTERATEHTVRAGTDGFLKQSRVKAGDHVQVNDVICEFDNPVTDINYVRISANVEKLEIERQSLIGIDMRQAAERDQELLKSQKQLLGVEERRSALTVRAPIAGQVTQSNVESEDGRFVRHGDSLFRLSAGDWVVRAVASAEQLSDTMPAVGQPVAVQMLDKKGYRILNGRVIHVAPAGSRRIENEALTHTAGGNIAVHSERREAVQPFFEVVIAIDAESEAHFREEVQYGMRATIRIMEESRTLGHYAYRRILQFYNQYLRS